MDAEAECGDLLAAEDENVVVVEAGPSCWKMQGMRLLEFWSLIVFPGDGVLDGEGRVDSGGCFCLRLRAWL